MPNYGYLPRGNVERVEKRAGSYIASATYPVAAEDCPRCGALDALGRHGSKTTAYRDAPVHGKQTLIVVDRQRYRCKACAITSLQPLPDVDERHRMSRRCLEYIQDQCLRRPFSQIAEDIGLD